MAELEPVVIVGGGIAGLVAARTLVLAGREVRLFEASDRVGGQVARHTVAGIELDAGAEAFANRGTAVRSLLAALKLDGDIVTPTASPAWVHRADGSAVPLPATSLLGIPGTPLAEDVIAAIGLPGALRAQVDSMLPSLAAKKADSLGSLVRIRMGNAVLERLVAPVVRGIHSVEPDELELDRAHPGLKKALEREGTLAAAVRSLRGNAPAGANVAAVRGGLFRIVDALVADLERFGVQMQTGVRIVEAEPGRVVTSDGQSITGDIVLASDLSGEAPRTTVTNVTIAVDAPELVAAPRGTGVLVAKDAPNVTARALTHVSAKWQWVAEQSPLQVLRLSYDAGIEVSPERAHRDAEVLLGQSLPAPQDASIVTWVRTGRRANAGHAIDGMHRVGEAESGTGLAAVVAGAAALAADLTPEDPARED